MQLKTIVSAATNDPARVNWVVVAAVVMVTPVTSSLAVHAGAVAHAVPKAITPLVPVGLPMVTRPAESEPAIDGEVPNPLEIVGAGA